MKQRKNYWLVGRIVLFFAPIVIFLYLTLRHTLNAPYNDDYHTILEFASDINNSTWTSYFAAYGEHRILFVRMVTWLSLQLFGHIDFRLFVLIGNLSFIGFFFVMLKSSTLWRDRYFYLLPIPFLLFHLQGWSNVTWAMTAVSNIMIFLFMMLCMFFAVKKGTKNLLLAGIFGIIATLANGNGMFVFFCLSATFLMRKEWWKALGSLVIFITIFVLSSNGGGDGIVAKVMKQNIGTVIAKFFAFMGSNVFHPSYVFVAVAVGVLAVLYFVYLTFAKQYYKVSPALYSLFILIFITAFAVSTQRDAIDLYNIAPSRFRVYGSILFCLIVIAFFETSKEPIRKYALYLVLPLTILFFAASNYIGLERTVRRQSLIKSQFFLMNNNIFYDDYIEGVYKKVLNKKLMLPPNIVVTSIANPALAQVVDVNFSESAASVSFQIDTAFIFKKHFIIKGWGGIDDDANALNKNGCYVYAQNGVSYHEPNFLEVPSFVVSKENLKFATTGFMYAIPYKAGVDSIVLSIARGREITRVTSLPIQKLQAQNTATSKPSTE